MSNIDTTVEFIKNLNAGDFTKAAAAFDQNMSQQVPVDGLKAGWAEVTKHAGAFKGTLDTKVENKDGYQVVFVTCQHERNNVAAYLVYDASGKVSGMGFAPGYTNDQLQNASA
jgi:hypothetical protein